jgi:hypothetical protein
MSLRRFGMLSRLTIQRKLKLYAVTVGLLLLVLVAASSIFTSTIRRADMFRVDITRMAETAGARMTAALEYLRFDDAAYVDAVDSLRREEARMLSSFRVSWAGDRLALLRRHVDERNLLLDSLIDNCASRRTHEKKTARYVMVADSAIREIVSMLDDLQADRQIEGATLTGDEQEFQSVARDAKILFLELHGLQSDYVATQDTALLSEFEHRANYGSLTLSDCIRLPKRWPPMPTRGLRVAM